VRRCLSALWAQSTDRFRVIIVDDGSTPPLAESIAELTTNRRVHLLRHDDSTGPAAARNAGVASSDADYIVFVDDDVAPNSTFVESHLRSVTSGSPTEAPIVSCGPFRAPADWSPTPWNLWEARSHDREAADLMNGVYPPTWRQCHTGNNCVPRRLFEEVGGFDESFTRLEDDELALRLFERGCTFHFVPDAVAWHYSHRSLSAWLEIPRAYAYFDVELDRLHPAVGHLATKRGELDQRHRLLRLARTALGGPRRRRVGVRLATTAARAAWRLRLTGATMVALSLAYDLSYFDELERCAGVGVTS
jgi:GT2 family glycosyltransferase